MSNHKFFAFLSTCPSCDGPMHKVPRDVPLSRTRSITTAQTAVNAGGILDVIIVKMVSFV